MSADVRVADVSTNRSIVTEGESIRVTAMVVNEGDTTGSHDVRLHLFGEVVAVRSVTVEGNDRLQVSFVRTILAPGTYEATVGEVSTTFTVRGGTRTETPIVTEPSSQPIPGPNGPLVLLGAPLALLAVFAATLLTRRRI